MNIKKFKAKTTQEAIQMVKREMGPDAVILKTRSISAFDAGIDGKGKAVEVTAAVDYEEAVAQEETRNQVDSGEMKRQWRQMEYELRQIKEFLLSADAKGNLGSDIRFNPAQNSRYSNFRTFGLRPDIIRELMRDWHAKMDNRQLSDSKILQDSLLNVLDRIKINTKRHKVREISAFIGPTGVGKTTTLAKIAAMKTVNEGKKTALITLDTFRIAAAAQLQTYARIMGIPFEVASSSADLKKAIDKYSGCDSILIDTAGRSPNRKQDIEELHALTDIPEEVHRYLVLSSATRYNDLLNTDNKFSALPFKSYIFTKLDETEDVSDMVNFLISKEKPISYFTTGQQVPDDIETASKKKLASLLLSKMKSNVENSIDEVNKYGSSFRA